MCWNVLTEEGGDIFALRVVDINEKGRLDVGFVVCDADGCDITIRDVELAKYSTWQCSIVNVDRYSQWAGCWLY